MNDVPDEIPEDMMPVDPLVAMRQQVDQAAAHAPLFAELMWVEFVALLEAGFTRAEALKIVIVKELES